MLLVTTSFSCSDYMTVTWIKEHGLLKCWLFGYWDARMCVAEGSEERRRTENQEQAD